MCGFFSPPVNNYKSAMEGVFWYICPAPSNEAVEKAIYRREDGKTGRREENSN